MPLNYLKFNKISFVNNIYIVKEYLSYQNCDRKYTCYSKIYSMQTHKKIK